MPTAPAPDARSARGRIALNRRRQRELYGCPLGDRVRTLTGTLGITQARLAHTLGISPPMLSQLASARRVKIGDPAVLARLQLLDRRCGASVPREPAAVEALLDEVARARLQWTAADTPPGRVGSGPDARPGGGPGIPRVARRGALPRCPPAGPPSPVAALRALAPPARLAAAAVALAPAFPELAAVLRQAAAHPRAPGQRPRGA
jgi:transcriptional regulator with XRE-family HTH domain